MSTIGDRIRDRRILLDMTQEELATKIGYTNKTTISKIENGANDFPRNKLLKFANALDVSPEYLLTGQTDVTSTYVSPAQCDKILSDWRTQQAQRMKLYDNISQMYNSDIASHIMMLLEIDPDSRDDIFKQIEEIYVLK